MSYELRGEAKQWQIGTIQMPKYEVYDLNGGTGFELDSATFTFKNSSTNAIVLSGDCAINNFDTDIADNTIKTIQATLDLENTDIDVGKYSLAFRVYFTNGQDDKFRIVVEVKDFE